MNPRFINELRAGLGSSQDAATSATKEAPKRAKSEFDQALERATPKPVAEKKTVRTPAVAAAKSVHATPSARSTVDAPTDGADVQRARQIAATLGMPLLPMTTPMPTATPMLSARTMSSTREPQLASGVKDGPTTSSAAASSAEKPGVTQDDEPTVVLDPTAEPSEPTIADAVPDDGVSTEGMDAAHDEAPMQDLSAVMPAFAQVAAADRAERAPAVDAHETRTEKNRVDDIAALMNAPRNVAEPAHAVEGVVATRDVEWHGLAEKVADVAHGSIEGNRARVVLGEGDDRVVLTVSTHAHRVAIEVETSTKAGSALADALRQQPEELKQALGQHGLELAQGGQSHTRDEATYEQGPVEKPKSISQPELRRSGVVLA